MAVGADRARNAQITFVVGFFVLAGAFAILLARTFRNLEPYDLMYIVTAGRMWLAGLDPYGPGFVAAGADQFGKVVEMWAYPPQWWLIATGLGLLNYATAVVVWKCLNLAALIAGGVLLERAAFSPNGFAPAWATILFWVMLATADPTRTTLHLGQTSLLMVLGFGLLMHGMVTDGLAPKAAGLAILMLKPQFGLFFLALALADRAHRRAAFAAVAVTAVACLPFLLQRGVAGAMSSLLLLVDNIAAYGDLRWNRPLEVNGAAFVSAILGGPRLPTLPLLAVAVAGALWLKAWLSQGGHRDPRLFWLASLGVFYVVVPLHFYDLILVPSFLLLIHLLKPWAVGLALLANLIFWRASTLIFDHYKAQVSAWGDVLVGSIVQSILSILIGVLLLAAVIASRGMLTSPRAAARPSAVDEPAGSGHWTAVLTRPLVDLLGSRKRVARD